MLGKISKQMTVSRIMGQVLLVLIPPAVAQILFFGWGVLINILIVCTIAVATESVCLAISRKNILFTLKDLSAPVSGLLLALCLPPQLPPTELVLGTIFMMVLGKHIYGGLGNNLFNPAMLAYVMLLLSFPVSMTSWLEPKFLTYLSDTNLLSLKFFGNAADVDGYTGATALDAYRGLFQQDADTNFRLWWDSEQALSGTILGAFLIMNFLFLLGGAWLLWQRIISWEIPTALLAGLLLPSLLFNILGDGSFPPIWFHLIFGGGIYGALFIATDPVTAPAGPKAHLIYGLGIGLMTYVIRTWGGYADAVAFAVLFFNVAAPFIDKYTRPLPVGYDRTTDNRSGKI